MSENMNCHRLMNVAVTAGEIMLASGAETYRVEDTINRILKLSGYEDVSSFVMSTGITATLIPDHLEETITMVRRVKSRSNKLQRIGIVNDMSRKLCAGQITLEEAEDILKKARNYTEYNRAWWYVGVVGTATFFAPLVGGGFREMLATLIISILMTAFMWSCEKLHMHNFLENMFTSILIAFLAVKLGKWFDVTDSSVIIACIMPLVPGAAITNAVRDTFHGDYTASVARILEAVVTAIAIAVGAAAGMMLA